MGWGKGLGYYMSARRYFCEVLDVYTSRGAGKCSNGFSVIVGELVCKPLFLRVLDVFLKQGC